jgi:hypothetical protein
MLALRIGVCRFECRASFRLDVLNPYELWCMHLALRRKAL